MISAQIESFEIKNVQFVLDYTGGGRKRRWCVLLFFMDEVIVKKSLVALFLLISAFVFYFFFRQQEKTEVPVGGPVQKIVLGAYAGAYGFLPYIAQEFGFFKKNGVEVDFQEYPLGLEATNALLHNKVDIATAADFVVTSHAWNHPDLRILATIAKSNTNEILALRDKGILTPSDLKGKRIGVTFKTKGEFFLGRFLIYNQLSLGDVNLINMSPHEITEALIKGDIDAASIWEPYLDNIKNNYPRTLSAGKARPIRIFIIFSLLGRLG